LHVKVHMLHMMVHMLHVKVHMFRNYVRRHERHMTHVSSSS
jgi:hypothetical protein